MGPVLMIIFGPDFKQFLENRTLADATQKLDWNMDILDGIQQTFFSQISNRKKSLHLLDIWQISANNSTPLRYSKKTRYSAIIRVRIFERV